MLTVSTADPEKVFAAYAERLARKEKSAAHQREYRITTTAFKAWLVDNDRALEGITRTDIEDFFISTGWAPSTMRARLTCLRRPWKYAVENRILERTPFDGMEVELPEGIHKEPKTVSIRDLRAIKAEIRTASDWALFHVLAYTGMRIGEVRGLKWTDVSFADQTIFVLGKGNRERRIPLHPALAEALTALPMFDRGELYVFPGQRQPMLTHGGAWAKVKSLVGGRDIAPHDFRRTFATSMHDNGAPDPAIRQIMGHPAHRDSHAAYHRVGDRYLYREILKVYADAPL